MERFLARFPEGQFTSSLERVADRSVRVLVNYGPPGGPLDYLKFYALLERIDGVDLTLAIGRYLTHLELQEALSQHVARALARSGDARTEERLKRRLFNRAYVYGVIGTGYHKSHLTNLRGDPRVRLLSAVLDELAQAQVEWEGVFLESQSRQSLTACEEAGLLAIASRARSRATTTEQAQIVASAVEQNHLMAVPIRSSEGMHVGHVAKLLEAFRASGIDLDSCFILLDSEEFEPLSGPAILSHGRPNGVLLIAMRTPPEMTLIRSVRSIRP